MLRRCFRLLALVCLIAGSTALASRTASADRDDHASSLQSAAKRFSVGYDHACFASDGKVYCWGNNSYGQSGQSPTIGGVSLPTLVPDLTGVDTVSAGNGFTCAVKTDGTVWCWGNGQLMATGQAAGINQVPTQVTGVTGAVSVTAGYYHACALLTTGSIQCWGQGDDGQLGNADFSDSQTAVTVSNITTAVAVSAGSNYTCAVLADGSGRCWGYNMMGQLGDHSTSTSNIPVTVKTAAGGDLAGAVGISVAKDHSCAVTSSKMTYCWGADYNGMLGSAEAVNPGASNTRAVPVRASRNSGSYATDVVGVTTGEAHTCILRESGAVACFGDNQYAQVGNGTLSGISSFGPDAVTDVAGMVAVSAGRRTTCALGTFTIKCWGEGNNGQRGDNTGIEKSLAVDADSFLAQSVTFEALTNGNLVDGTRTVTATSTSGGSVTFSSTTTSVCTVSGSTVTYVAPGTCTVRASLGEYGMFVEAASVDRSFTITGVKPVVTTGAATSVSGSRATMNAVVNPKGGATTVNFVYGQEADLSDGVSQAATVATSMNDTDVSTTVTGLVERTKYYFRVEATNSEGTTKGDILSFTTARPVGVSVNDAAEFTKSRSVTVYVTGTTGSVQAILSNDGGFSRSKTFTLTDSSAEIPWTLVASKDERLPKVVYVKFVSRLGTASTPYQDDIILDTTAPVMSGAAGTSTASSPNNVTAAAVRKGGVSLRVRASDKNSGIGKVQVKTSSRGRVTDVPTSKPKATSRTVRINTTKKRLWVRVVDRAGNASKWVTVTVK
ncbi:MAG: RCC1 domain-containing protein [Ilumatobacteraceae bacterium]